MGDFTDSTYKKKRSSWRLKNNQIIKLSVDTLNLEMVINELHRGMDACATCLVNS